MFSVVVTVGVANVVLPAAVTFTVAFDRLCVLTEVLRS